MVNDSSVEQRENPCKLKQKGNKRGYYKKRSRKKIAKRNSMISRDNATILHINRRLNEGKNN